MTKLQIALKYLNAIPLNKNTNDNPILATTIMAEMLKLGFAPTRELHETLQSISRVGLRTLYNSLFPALQKIKGADVKYAPMYPNFPEQVMNASDLELLINAIVHYWTMGEVLPEYENLHRSFFPEDITIQQIDVCSESEFNAIFPRLLSSNDSISTADKITIKWFVNRNKGLKFPDTIPFKENMCYLAGLFLERGMDIAPMMKTATDVLRVATFLSDGDISLAENTKYKSFPRKMRRVLVRALETVATEEDINRHRGKWIRLFHSLHVGEYSNSMWNMAKKVRNNEHISTFNGRVQALIDDKNVKGAVKILIKRPGDFARRLDHLIRIDRKTATHVINAFLKVADQVSTRVLFQLMGNMKTRLTDTNTRVVFPKGNAQKAMLVKTELPKLAPDLVEKVIHGLSDVLIKKFSTLEPMGNVWIEEAMNNCPLPAQQRSASDGSLSVGRGTQLPISKDKSTLRLFIYWVGRDIDLSATFYSEDFTTKSHISYTNLRNAEINSYHSGDITSAPHGASEFIDVNIEHTLRSGKRYVVMNVLVYDGPTFAEHDKCYAGWMTRSKPNSNEIYDPRTVEAKINLTSNTTNSIPVVFDLKNRTAIWTDLTYNFNSSYYNNVESNRATIEQTMQSIITLDNKSTLADLFLLHALARGTVCETREEADIVFAMEDADVTPFNVDIINSEYLV
jgi:hypothetical protein